MTSRTRVLHVCATYYPAAAYGGPVVSTHALLKEQCRLGADVRVVTTDANGRERLAAGTREVDGIRVHYARAVPLNRYGVSFGLFERVLREMRWCDVLHVHGTSLPSTTVALWAAAVARRPVILSPRGSLMRWALSRKRLKKRMYRVFDAIPLRRAVIHATSEAEAADARSIGFERVAVVPNGVDTGELRRRVTLDIRAQLGVSQDATVIAWLGRFDPVKNLEALLEATKEHDAAVVLAGDAATPYGRSLRLHVSTGRRTNVHFVGPVDGERKAALLQQASLYVHPSHMESYGMSIVEALAAGCPVVASTGTPWQELELANAGRWVAPNATALAAAIHDVLSRDRELLSRNARALAERHAWAQRARALLEVYEDAVLGAAHVTPPERLARRP